MMNRISSLICSGSRQVTVNGTVVNIAEKRPWNTLWCKIRVLTLEISDPATPLKHLTVFDDALQFPEARVGSVLSVAVAHATERQQHFFNAQPIKVVAVK